MNNLWTIATILATVSAYPAMAADQNQKPNVLFIAVDDLRPEMGCYGNPVVKTPNFDRLAARGIVFNHAYCQQAVCSPSRSSLMTSRRPDATRVWDLETHFRVALPDAVTLPQHFKANGYYCAALSKIYHHGFEDGRSWSEPHWYPSGQTIDTDTADCSKRIVKKIGGGVQEYLKRPMPADNDKPNAGKRGKAVKGAAFEVSPKSDDELPDGYTASEAVKRLHELKVKRQPFFLAVGFLKPHLPFIAPKKYWDLYDPNKIPLPAIDHLPDGAPVFAGHDNGELHSYANVPKGNPIPADFAKTLRHGYYACVSYTDAQVGRLLDALDHEGLADNTIIVLWGDHGWQLGEHGLWHKHTNFELATRAPLLISMPGQKTAGQKCDAPVEFVDVYPTLADVCGLSIPSGLDGTSLKPWLENPFTPAKKVAISQYPRGGVVTGNRPLMGYSIRDARWRLTLWRDRTNAEIVATELYDERNDPAETVNLAGEPENKAIVEGLSKHLPPPVEGEVSRKKSNAAAKPKQDRAALFEKKDKNHDGKLSFEEFMANQPDPEAAKKRFEQWDADKKGFLSREEFVNMGRKSIMPRLIMLAVLLLAPLAALHAAEKPATVYKPNIVIILADDLGYGDVGCYGATKVKTPNIDRLAAQGLRFTDAHSSASTCTPSRYSLLTGEYAWRRKGTGILPGNAALIIEPDRATLPALLKRAGYTTGAIGKWHLGLGSGNIDWNNDIKPGPLEIGFDYGFIMPATGDRVPCVYVENHRIVGLDPADPIQVDYRHKVGDDPTGREHPEMLKMKLSAGHDGTIVNGISRIGFMSGGKAARWNDETLADTLTQKAVAFIERSKDKPFFLYLATHDIHVPRCPGDRFKGKTELGVRGDVIEQVDWCAGEIIATLERLKLSEKTLVVFTSDNGPIVDDGYADGAVQNLDGHKPAGPFRGGKYTIWEGGTRMPFIVRWPGRVKPGTSDALISQVDFCATFAKLTGVKPSASASPDSSNVLPALLGDSPTGRAVLVEQGMPLALRQGSWKFIARPGKGKRGKQAREPGDEKVAPIPVAPEAELYNLVDDIAETRNLAPTNPLKSQELSGLLEKIRQQEGP